MDLEEAINQKDFEMAKKLIKNGITSNQLNECLLDLTLQVESSHFEIQMTLILLKEGADPNKNDSEGNSPLRWNVEFNHLEMVKLLLEQGAGSQINEWGGLRGLTPLGLAARNLNLPMIKLLLVHGASLGALDEFDEKAFEKLPAREVTNHDLWDKCFKLLKGSFKK